MVLLKNEFAKIIINRIFIWNLKNIKLIISESCWFNIFNGQIYNIENSFYDTPLMTCWVVSDTILNNRVEIYNM